MKTPVLLAASIFFCVAGATAQDWIETAPVADPPHYPKTALPSPSIDSLFGFSIDRDEHSLRMYDLGDAEALVQQYMSGGMKWFYSRHQPELFYPVLDSNLIPLIEYSFGFRRNPVMTSQAALAFYTAYVETGSEEHLRGFMNNVDWLLENRDDFYFRYDFPWRHGGRTLNSDWVSAMAQGEALAAMSSAYFLTGETQYLDAATGIFQTLNSNSDSTWSIYTDEHQYYWLEEYPNPDLCHVLNGMLFGLWGLWDYYAITGDPFALDLFRAGIQTVADHYDVWNIRDQNASRYCLHGLHFPFYHETHIRQFEAYLQHFDIPEFAAAIDLFTRDPMIAVSTLDLDFGDIQIGESAEEDFVLYNTGRGPVDVTDISLTSPFFNVSTRAASIPEQDSLVVTVIFAPTSPGLYTDVLQVESNAGAFPIDVAGYGVDARIAIEEKELGFRDVLALSSDTLWLHVQNNTMAEIRIDSAAAQSGAFRLSPGDHVLQVGIRTAMSVVFAPAEVGVFVDTLSIYFDSEISTHPIPVSGTSLSPLRLVGDRLRMRMGKPSTSEM